MLIFTPPPDLKPLNEWMLMVFFLIHSEYEEAKECFRNLTLHYCDGMNTKRNDYNPFCDQANKPVIVSTEEEIGGMASRVENTSFVEVKFKSSMADYGLSHLNAAATTTKNTIILLTGLLCFRFF